MLEKLEHIIELILKTLTTVLLGALTALVTYTVILRFFFHSGFPAGEELCRYLFVWSAFFGIILGVKAKSHMAIDFLEEKFPKAKLLFKICYYVFHYLFFAIMVYFGYMFTSNAATARSTLLPITMNYIYAAVPACGVGCIIVVTTKLLKEFQRPEKAKKKEGQE